MCHVIERYGIRADIMLRFSLYDSTHLPWSLVTANGEAGSYIVSQSQASYCVQGRDRCGVSASGWI